MQLYNDRSSLPESGDCFRHSTACNVHSVLVLVQTASVCAIHMHVVRIVFLQHPMLMMMMMMMTMKMMIMDVNVNRCGFLHSCTLNAVSLTIRA